MEYNPRSALVVVDMQNDFVDPKGSLHVEGGEDVLPFVNGEIEKAAAAGATVIYTRDWHPDVTPHFEKDGGVWPVHCVGDTWGSEFHPDLKVLPGSEIIHKGSGGEDGYSAFSMRNPVSGDLYPTRLEYLLRAKGIERIVIAGLATDYCVKETVLDGRRLGFEVTVLEDGVRAVNLREGDGDRALKEAVQAGAQLA